MKIYGILLTKNEGDILEYCLRDALRWCERVFVYDNGSDDNTWSTVEALSQENDRIVPFKSDGQPFHDGLRSEVFNAFREEVAEGDWWCRLDTDEFYIDDPRVFLKKLSRCYHCVWSIHLQYYLTEKDLPRFDAEGKGEMPVIDESNAPRYYKANFSEQRFFKHRKRLTWSKEQTWPRHVGVVAPERIRIRHYQYRSPQQIQLRLDTRRKAAEQGWHNFPNSLAESWKEKIADASTLHLDDGEGEYQIDLRDIHSHAEPTLRRFAKLLLHGFGILP